MKHLLILILTFALLSGCVSGSESGDCDTATCGTSEELLDVVISVFSNSDGGDTHKIIAMLPDGSEKKVIYDVAQCGIMDPMIGCDGRTVLFTDMCVGEGIYSLYIPDTRLKLLYSGNDEGPGIFSKAVFSPDMKEIYMLKGYGDVSVLTLSTGLVTELHHNYGLSGPCITANGKHVVCAGAERHVSKETGEWEEVQGIMTMDPDQRNLKMVKRFDPVEGQYIMFSALSVVPATSEIIYALNLWTADDYEGVNNVYKTNLDGTGQTLLFSVEGEISHLSSNRRGDMIAYFCESYEGEIKVAHLQGNTVTRTSTIDLGTNTELGSARFTVINRNLFNSLPDLVIP